MQRVSESRIVGYANDSANRDMRRKDNQSRCRRRENDKTTPLCRVALMSAVWLREEKNTGAEDD
jgi:hypothetical protein